MAAKSVWERVSQGVYRADLPTTLDGWQAVARLTLVRQDGCWRVSGRVTAAGYREGVAYGEMRYAGYLNTAPLRPAPDITTGTLEEGKRRAEQDAAAGFDVVQGRWRLIAAARRDQP